MVQSIREKIAEAVEAEKKSREYAEQFYEQEAVMASHFVLDTALLDRLIPPGSRIFDAMMARGRHVLHFARKGYSVYGNDRNKHMVKLVEEELRNEGLKAKLLSIDVTNLKQVRDDYFDSVICMYSSLGCIPGSFNRQKAMREFARILKPGGIVVVHAHSPLDTLEKPTDLLWMLKGMFWKTPAGLERGDWYYLHGSSLGYSYIHEFRPKEFRNLFTSAGLKVVKEFYLNLKQDRIIHDLFSFASGGFIFVGRKT